MEIFKLLSITLGAILANNFIFSQFLGCCPFLGVSKKVDTAVGMGVAVTFVMGLASAVCFVVNKYILIPLDLAYMQTVAFILVIASLVQFIEMFLQKAMPALYTALGVYLPLITTNCAVLGVVLLITAVILWMRNLRNAREVELTAKSGKHVNTFRDDLNDALDRKFHRTLLTLPVLGVVLFTIIPLIVMILIGFTNYDRNHLPPSKLFTWVGLDNFTRLTALTADSSFGYAFTRVLVWTLVWAVLATFTCYIGGILMAMFINNRNTKGKKFWRTCFMVAMAVPQFVSLLLVRNFFADLGIVNTICKNIGLTDWLYSIGAIPTANFIPFLTHPAWARPMIILINIWVGIPYQMLIATGILMNIPTELIEAAKIDGANAWQSFKSITMPYILFITGPSLVNSLVANINNFNVIWLLSRDVYTTSDQLMANANANEVDLLVTWLYRLTQDQSNYKMASVIGILVFVVCAILTLVAFSRMIKGDKEESFQ